MHRAALHSFSFNGDRKMIDSKDVKLIHGDCLTEMKQIPDASVDMILCDLPYGTTKNKWDCVIPFDPLWEQYRRITKDNAAIVLFGAEPFSSILRLSNLTDYKYDWIWDKSQVTGFLNAKKQPLRQHEIISVFYAKQCVYNPQMIKGKPQLKGTGRKSSNYGNFSPNHHISDVYYPKTILNFPQQRISGGHPTQKPVALLEYLIKTYTNEGETVLDNTMGSGSTGVACIRTKRKFIGIELNDEYFGIAQKRISQEQQQLSLF